MELYEEILLQLARESKLPLPHAEWAQLVELQCYRALQEIQAIVQDDSLSDPECFQRMELVLDVFGWAGLSGGVRHDFG